MTPLTQLNSSPSFFPAELKEDQLFTPNPQPSSSSLSSHIFFNLTPQDQNGYTYHGEVHHPHNQQDQADNFGSHGGSYDIENESDSGLKFSIWKQEVRNENQSENENQVKWMSSKTRLMQKMKNSDQTAVNAPPSAATMKLEDQKQPSSPMETDNCSNSSSNNSNNPIRVCSDCNTTKTPLWRSGPRGPKSLCNACGIRQRKARRAMAAAAAAANGTILPTASPTPKISKVQYKDKRSNGGHVTKFKKKQCKLAATPSQGREKLCLEDFLMSLSKNLAFHRVFPQDEKEAAILLMALSCGHVHG